MKDLPCTSHVLVNMDCKVLHTAGGRRCDYVFVGETAARAWVAPIELKSGDFRGQEVAAQLQAGAAAADRWLPASAALDFVPVLAHNGIHREQRRRLRRAPIKLRDQVRQPLLIRCGAPLSKVLAGS